MYEFQGVFSLPRNINEEKGHSCCIWMLGSSVTTTIAGTISSSASSLLLNPSLLVKLMAMGST
jgi:hypothetical protein